MKEDRSKLNNWNPQRGSLNPKEERGVIMITIAFVAIGYFLFGLGVGYWIWG